MQLLDREKPFAEWLEANYPEVLEAYASCLGLDLGKIYFLDLWAWLRRDRLGIWSEYAAASAEA